MSEAPRRGGGPGLSEALTYAWADRHGEICGVARVGLAGEVAGGLVVLFAGGEPVVARTESDGPGAGSWAGAGAGGLTAEGDGPWRLVFDGEVGFELVFEAVAEPFLLRADARAGGLEGADHVCRVRGTVGGQRFEGMGQLGRSWGALDSERTALARTVAAWFDDAHAVSLVAVRPPRASAHGEEVVAAQVLEDGAVREVADARLSTTYEGEGRLRSAGLELYVGADDEHAVRAAGEVVARASLEVGAPAEAGAGLRLDCAFLRWRMQGRQGIGRYDVLRRGG